MIAIAVALGGAIGALSRYGTVSLIERLLGTDVPWGTLGVNVIGSLALGFLLVWLPAKATSEELSLFATVGVLGSFTTFSTFSWETVELVKSGAWWKVVTYTGGSVALGIAAIVVGAACATALSSPTP